MSATSTTVLEPVPPAPRREHWSKWTWAAALAFFVLGSVIAYFLAREASPNTGIVLAVLLFLTMVGTLAAMGALSVKHRAGVPGTVVALFVTAMLAGPVFGFAAVQGVADRAQDALADIFDEDESLSLDEGSVGEEPVEDPASAGEGEVEGEEELPVEEQVAVDFFTAVGSNLPASAMTVPGSPAAAYAAYRDLDAGASGEEIDPPVVTPEGDGIRYTFSDGTVVDFGDVKVTDGKVEDFTRAGKPIAEALREDLGRADLPGGGVIDYQRMFINESSIVIAGEIEAGSLPVSYGEAVYVGPDKAQVSGEWTATSETQAGARTPFVVSIPGAKLGGRVTLTAYDVESYEPVETTIELK